MLGILGALGGLAFKGIKSLFGGGKGSEYAGPLASGIGGYLGARQQAGSAAEAAALQEKYAREGIGAIQGRTLNANEVLNPFYQTGYNAGQSLANEANAEWANSPLNRRFTLQDFQEDPGYQFRLAEGERGIRNDMAARGGLYSGGALKGMERFRQGLAAQEYGNAFDRFKQEQQQRYNQLLPLYNTGYSAASQQSGNIFNEGLSELEALTGIGNVQGAGAAARGSAYGNFFNNAGNSINQALTLRQILNSQNPNNRPIDPRYQT